MSLFRLAVSSLTLVLCACGGPVASGPASTAGTGASPSAPSSTAGVSTAGPAVDLSGVDVCTVVPAGTAEALTGETGFTTDGSSSASSAKCFWGVPRPGVPQYLEVEISRRTTSLDGYGISPNGVACPGATVAGVGAQAVGAVCSGDQTKVWLAAMGRGVMVQVIVNEPKSALTPADLAAIVSGVLAGLP